MDDKNSSSAPSALERAIEEAYPTAAATLGEVAERAIEIRGFRKGFTASQPAQSVGLTDEQIDTLVRSACHSDPTTVDGDYCLTVDEIRAILARQTAPTVEQHPDDIAVDRFAAAMKAKMAKSRAKGRGGWDDPAQCGTQDLADMLVDHIEKGDPVDIGNFAMMLWNRGAWAGDLVSALGQYVMRESRGRQFAKYGPNNPPRLRKPGESVEDYRVAMGWDQPKPAAQQEQAAEMGAVPEDDRWTILHNGKSVSADTLTGCMAAARQLRTPEEAAKAAENLAAAIAADLAEEQAERAAGEQVDWLGLALDLEQQAKRVESQTVERAMLAGAHGLRLMGAAPQQPAAERAAVPEGWVSVKDRLPKTEHECTSRDMMVSNSFFVRGTAVDGGEGFGMADYQEDGKWHCYGGDYDFMHITEVTHYLPAAAPSPAAPVAQEGETSPFKPGSTFMVGMDSLLRHYEAFSDGKIDTKDVRSFVLRYSPAQQTSSQVDAPASCKHDWPEADGQTDLHGCCTKCGMSFQRYIHTECP